MSLAHSPRIVTDGLVLALDAANPKNYNLTAVEVLVVAGGGGGGMDMGGGGGGGGVIYNSNFTVTPGSALTVTVGAGGYGAPAGSGGYRTDGAGPQPGGHQFTIPATNGGNSVFGSLTAIGGGAGGSSYRGYTPGIAGANGGSGGGSSGYNDNAGTFYGGTGTSGQGFAGGNSTQAYYSGGGGGAGGAGVSSPNRPDGGPGILYSSMSPYYFGGGGGGASYSLSTGGYGGIGGGGGGALGTAPGGAGLNNGSAGGGGGPNQWANTPGGNAGANTGGGGGGGSHYNSNNKGGEGGSGIVIVRYPGPQRAIGGTVTSVGGYTIHTFTTTGSTTFTPLVATNNSAILGLSDFSGNNNFGTSVNGVTYSSANGGSLSFDGVNDYMQANVNTTSLDGDPSLTVDMFVKRRAGTNIGGSAGFWGIGGAGQGNSIEGWTPTTNLIHLDVYDSTRLATSVSYPENQFIHICWTKNGPGTETTNVKCYVNGAEVSLTKTRNATRTNQFNTSTNGVGICLGRINADSASFHAPIDIGSFKVYNRALTASEVQQNFNALRSRFSI